MIAALGKLSERDSNYKELFQELINLLKDLNKELANNSRQSNKTALNVKDGDGVRIPFAQQPQRQPQQQQPPQQPKQTIARDYSSELNNILGKLNDIDNSINNIHPQ
jgi:HSP90 family molecular chaperone